MPISPNVGVWRWESKQSFSFFTNYFCHFRVYHQEQKSIITLRRDCPKACSVIFSTLPLSVAVQSSHLLPSDVIGQHVVQTSFIQGPGDKMSGDKTLVRGNQSRFSTVHPKGVEIKTLCRPVKYLHNKLRKLFMDLCRATLSCWKLLLCGTKFPFWNQYPKQWENSPKPKVHRYMCTGLSTYFYTGYLSGHAADFFRFWSNLTHHSCPRRCHQSSLVSCHTSRSDGYNARLHTETRMMYNLNGFNKRVYSAELVTYQLCLDHWH